MVFSSLVFIYFFLPIVMVLYFFGGIRYKNIILVISGLVFYAWGEPFYICIMLLSTAIDYTAGRFMDKFDNDDKKRRICLLVSVIMNISLLAIFKYSDFFTNNINNIFHTSVTNPVILANKRINHIFPFSFGLSEDHVALPIGISFFTFQNISYTMDCWWDRTPAQRSFRKYLLYISMFPQLVAGPIVRYSLIAEEIDDRHASLEDISYGFSRVIIGIAKKVIIANNLNSAVTAVFGEAADSYKATASLTAFGAWYGAALVALWYYFDFSGYSDIAIGLGRIFGFHFDENFNYPFMCRTISEFWQRWHISLGSFFRDYLLYVPIFGKRRKYGGLFLVWFCTGLWHGASWNFVLWGLYYGLFVFIETLIGKKKMKKLPAVIAHIYTKAVIIIGFGIFYFESMPAMGRFFKALVGLGKGTNTVAFNIFMQYVFLFAAAVLFSIPTVKFIKDKAKQKGGSSAEATLSAVGIAVNAGLLILSSILLLNATNNPFLYFRF